jgi:hypothetical protein
VKRLFQMVKAVVLSGSKYAKSIIGFVWKIGEGK